MSVAASVLGAVVVPLLCAAVVGGNVAVRLVLGAAGVLGAAVVWRLLALRAAGVRECASWAVMMVVALLPRSSAVRYVREFGDDVGAAGGRRRLPLRTLIGAPRLVLSTWGSALRTRVVAVVVRGVRAPVRRYEELLSTAPPLWPATRREFHAARRCWRRLRWCSGVVRVAAGHWRHPALVARASTLATRCRRVETQTRRDRVGAPREHSATAVALGLQVYQATREFSAALNRVLPEVLDEIAREVATEITDETSTP
ncbi:MAG: hypothetical protein ACRDQ5_16980 [Sciscionella sp.]